MAGFLSALLSPGNKACCTSRYVINSDSSVVVVIKVWSYSNNKIHIGIILNVSDGHLYPIIENITIFVNNVVP